MERELAHIERVIDIKPIPGADRVEYATVLGWHVMVAKGDFKVGDLAVYIEIDSKCPETEPFKFLEKRHYIVKTQKFFKGTVLSQGLLMPMEALGLNPADFNEGDGVTELLGIKYSVAEDNYRKAPSQDKYKQMANRHPDLFKKKPIMWLMKRNWGKKLLFVFFGRKKDKKNGWPEWVKHTDEERIQNCPWVLEGEKKPWVVTEKIDGSSSTYTMYRHKTLFGHKDEFYVCSRNVVMDTPDRKNFYSETEGNVYWEMAIKYDMESVLKDLLDRYPENAWVTIQGEIYGRKIQKRDYGLDEHKFAAFNLIMEKTGRWNSGTMKRLLEKEYSVPCVPIVVENFHLPDTVDQILDYATGTSFIDGGMREGFVFRSQDGVESFKAVSNEYLLKYH